MSTERKRQGWNWEVRWAFVVLLGVYVGGYFVFGEHTSQSWWPHRRHYRLHVLRQVYTPLAWLECKFRNQSVEISSEQSGHTVGVYFGHD